MQSSPAASEPIPAIVRLGVTGHRTFPMEQAVRASVTKVLAQLDESLKVLHHTPHTYTVISPLAEGADRLVAREVLAWAPPEGAEKPSLKVVLPLPEADYLYDLETRKSKDEFKSLLALATSTVTLDKVASRTAAYERAGRWVVDNCDVLIAVWDGKPAQGQGGTAEVVEYARKVGRIIFWIHSETGEIIAENHKDYLLDSLRYLDIYNGERVAGVKAGSATQTLYQVIAGQAKESGLADEHLEPLRQHLLPLFVRADLLAQRYQYRFTRAGTFVYVLAALAVATVTIQTLFFPHFPQLLWLEVAAIGMVIILLWATRSGDWHRKWIDYRFLAERVRAALFLYVAGIECNLPKPPPHLSISHRPDDWMIRAFGWIWKTRPPRQSNGEMPFEVLKKFLLLAWVDDQAAYYGRTSTRYDHRQKRLTRGAEVLFWLTLAIASMHSLGLGDTSADLAILPNFLTSLAIILPVIGAAIGGIRVHREYLRNAERYGHMARYLSTLGDQMQRAQDLESLTALLQQANEVMIRENQDWRVLILTQELHVG